VLLFINEPITALQTVASTNASIMLRLLGTIFISPSRWPVASVYLDHIKENTP